MILPNRSRKRSMKVFCPLRRFLSSKTKAFHVCEVLQGGSCPEDIQRRSRKMMVSFKCSEFNGSVVI